ncbi:MAG: c-type cytochrome [Verrucomicrobia bacterium]|nr:c-type cytochrome [Verrucomicrobiota bacterium]
MKNHPDASKHDSSEPPLRPHVYDGIQEFDNSMPNWWLWTFYGAIIFSVIYWFSYYDSEMMESDSAKMVREMSRIEEARLASVGELNNETLWAMSRNAGFVSSGMLVYQENCASCHGANREGGIGLALNDGDWKYGGSPMEIFDIVANGSPDRTAGMQAWERQLGPQRISQVVAYILSYMEP